MKSWRREDIGSLKNSIRNNFSLKKCRFSSLEHALILHTNIILTGDANRPILTSWVFSTNDIAVYFKNFERQYTLFGTRNYPLKSSAHLRISWLKSPYLLITPVSQSSHVESTSSHERSEYQYTDNSTRMISIASPRFGKNKISYRESHDHANAPPIWE